MTRLGAATPSPYPSVAFRVSEPGTTWAAATMKPLSSSRLSAPQQPQSPERMVHVPISKPGEVAYLPYTKLLTAMQPEGRLRQESRNIVPLPTMLGVVTLRTLSNIGNSAPRKTSRYDIGMRQPAPNVATPPHSQYRG